MKLAFPSSLKSRGEIDGEHLFHEASLAVTVGVYCGVELVHQAGLVGLTCRANVVISVDPAVVVAVLGSKVFGRNLAVVVAVDGVLGLASQASAGTGTFAFLVRGRERAGGTTTTASGGVLSQTTLAETSVGVVVSHTSVITMAGMVLAECVGSLLLEATDGTKATGCTATNVLGDTLELVVALLTTSESTTLGLKLFERHSRKGGGLVEGSLVMVNLVDWDGGVDDLRLDDLPLNNGLDGLVDVVMNVLSANSRSNALAVGGLLNAPLVLEASLVGHQIPLDGLGIAVVELPMLNCADLGLVLLGKNLAVVDWLYSAVVVVLVDLLVNCSVDLLVHMGLDNLLCDGGSHCLVDCGVMVAGTAHEVGDSCLRLVHCECVVGC